MLHSNPPSF